MTNLGILYATRRLGVDKVEEGWSLLERASAEGDAVAARTMAALGSIEAVQGAASSSDLTSLLFTRF
jgi:hypothetical protein